MKRTTIRAIAVLAVSMAMGAIGCASQTIQNDDFYKDRPGFRVAKDAEIPDNTKNREVLDILARYQSAVTQKDFASLERLVSGDYYDNSGTTDTTEDDYSNEALGDTFEMMANYAEEIRYKIKVQDVEYENERALVQSEYEYAYKYQVGDKPTWDDGVDVNELDLIPDGEGGWKIASGL